jgi:hypothetical protein
VVEYVEAIRHSLRVGGRWVNHGPLQWHSPRALALSLEEVLEVVGAMGFRIDSLQRPSVAVPYGSHHEGELLKTDPYEPALWVATRAG